MTVSTDDISKLLKGLAVQAKKQLPHAFKRPGQKVIVIAGPTAVGKTAMAIRLAKLLGGEVVNADSMQIYQNMDIGTAKVTPDEMEGVPHHLIDYCPIDEPCNVVDFYYESRKAIASILARNRVPIVVGGSGFYLRNLVYGPPSGPPSIPEVRSQLEKEWEELGAAVMYRQLVDLDPAYARTITERDRQKIIRGLEIITLTKKPVSSLKWQERKNPTDYDYRCWFLFRPREELYERINLRCDQMLDKGFLEEVQKLQKEGLEKNRSAAQAIGYRQALEHLRGETDRKQFIHDFKKASRHYAKQQFTWFRKEPLFRWLDVALHDPETAADMVSADYQRLG